MYYSIVKRPKKIGEINEGPRLVETAGYMTAQQRIENIIDAGERLVQARKEAYDFPPGEKVDENYIDKTRTAGYDYFDAHEDLQTVEERIENGKKNKKEEIKSEEKKEEKESGKQETEPEGKETTT